MISWYKDSSCITPPLTSRPARCVPSGRPSRPAEEPLGVADALGQSVNFVAGVVQVERRPGARRHAERAVQGPGAVVVGPGRNAKIVEDLAYVVRVYIRHAEGHGTATVVGAERAEDAQAVDLAQNLERVRGQRLLVRGHVGHAEPGQVVDGRGQARGLRGGGHARLEPLRWRQEGAPLHPDHLDHRPAGQERWHRLKQLTPPVQHADPVRGEHLVPGEDQEVQAERCHIGDLVRHRLRAVTEHQRPDRVRPRGDLRDRRQGAGHIGLAGQGHDLGARVDQLVEGAEIQPALRGHRDPAQRGPGAQAELLPWHQVRVVLHFGDQHLVTRADPEPLGGRACGGRVAHRVGDQVDRLGRVLGEHDLARIRADEGRHLEARALVGVGGFLTEQVGAPVRGRVVPLVELTLGVENLPRLLRGGTRVEVHQGAAVPHRPGQDREVGPHRGHVEWPGGGLGYRHVADPFAGGSGGPSPRAGTVRNRSYPPASRFSASSGPPSSTIRPPTNTCTKSGVTYRRIRVEWVISRTPWSGSLRNRFAPSDTTRSASMSSPESVSSRIAIFGWSSSSWRISCRFFSPPEKPSLRLRSANTGSMDRAAIASRISFRKSRSLGASPRTAVTAVRRKLDTDTPGTSTGYCMARNRPARARASTLMASTFSPSRVTEPWVTVYFGCPAIA